MFKKLFITLSLTLTICLLNAADTTKQKEDLFAGVQQLSEAQMQSVTGEDIEIIEYKVLDGGYIQIISRRTLENDDVAGYIKINVETGEVEQNVYPINQ